MRYERPSIIRRDSLVGLLVRPLSDGGQPDTGDTVPSDRNIKNNIVPVRW